MPNRKTTSNSVPSWVPAKVRGEISRNGGYFRKIDFKGLSLSDALAITKDAQSELDGFARFKVVVDGSVTRGVFYSTAADELYDRIVEKLTPILEERQSALSIDITLPTKATVRLARKIIEQKELACEFSVQDSAIKVWGQDSDAFQQEFTDAQDELEGTEQKIPCCIYNKTADMLAECITATGNFDSLVFFQESTPTRSPRMDMYLRVWGNPEETAAFKTMWDETHEKHVFEMPNKLVAGFCEKIPSKMTDDELYIGDCGQFQLVLPFGEKKDAFYTEFRALFDRIVDRQVDVNVHERITLCKEVAKDCSNVHFFVDRNGPIKLTGLEEDVSAFKASLMAAANDMQKQRRGRRM